MLRDQEEQRGTVLWINKQSAASFARPCHGLVPTSRHRVSSRINRIINTRILSSRLLARPITGWPIRAKCPGHVIIIDQSEACIRLGMGLWGQRNVKCGSELGFKWFNWDVMASSGTSFCWSKPRSVPHWIIELECEGIFISYFSHMMKDETA